MEQGAVQLHPIRLVVTDDLRRSRLTVFFRLLLAIPHLIVVYVWGIVVFLAAIVNWFATLFAGRSPQGLHDFITSFLVYQTRVTAYLYLLADPWPPFGSSGEYPVDLQVDGPREQHRLTVAFRLILAIPALILASVFRTLNQVLAFVSWFYALATGHISEGIRSLGAYCLRYEQQTYGYVLLATQRYPSLSGAPTA
jgi:ABC-type multidrug transport system fused ATPase/permease subunit